LNRRRRQAVASANIPVSGESKPKRKVSRLRYVISVIVLGLVTFVYAALALGHIGNYEVISGSMLPTLHEGDRVLVDQRYHSTPAVGDVVVLTDPESPGELLTKRVAATAGQTVEIADGFLLVDGKKWAPDGLPPTRLSGDRQLQRTTIGEGEVFVLGDNVQVSEDSLAFGPVPVRSIKGRLLFIYWPPSRIRRVR